MPTNPPAVGEQNRLGETWNGLRWEGRNAAAPMIAMPPRIGSARTNQDDLELLKQLLTTGGTIVGGAVGGPPGAIIGGSAGRMIGHVPEAMITATNGQPNDSSFMGDAALGAMEGGAQEVLPAVAGPFAGFAGRGLKALGRMFGDVPGAQYKSRALAGLVRGIGARELGLPHLAQGAATVGPMVATEVGSGLERAGDAIGSDTLSTRVRSGIDALMERLRPAASHSDRMAAAADDYASTKTANRLQTAARERASGVTHFGEDIPEEGILRTPEPAEPTYGPWSPRGTDEPGPLGFSPDHVEMLGGLRRAGFQSDTAARIAGQDLTDPSLDAFRKYVRTKLR